MTIDRKTENALMNMFPGSILEILDSQLWIRTNAWKIDAGEFLVLQIYGLKIASVMVEGNTLTLIMTANSTKSILK